MEFRCWFISNMTIYIKSIAYISVTWKLEALHQGDWKYCQCHEFKKQRETREGCFVCEKCVW